MSGFIRRGKERGKENEVSKRGAKHIDDNAHKAKTLIRGFIKFCVCFALQRQADICIEKIIVRFGHILFVHAKQSVTMAVQVIVVLCLNNFPIIRAFFADGFMVRILGLDLPNFGTVSGFFHLGLQRSR